MSGHKRMWQDTEHGGRNEPARFIRMRQRIEQAEADLAELMWLVSRANPAWSGYSDEWWERQRVFLAAAPATLPAIDTRIVWKRDHGMVIVTGDEEPQSLEIPAWAVRTIFDVAGKDPEDEARKVSAFINAHTGLDVERLARALHESAPETHHRRKCIDRHDLRAAALAAAYDEQGDAGER